MTKLQSSSGGIGRRQFLIGASTGVAVGAAAGLAGSWLVNRPPGTADLVLYNGQVFTVAGSGPSVVEAVAITDGIVTAAGSTSDMRRYIGQHTDVVNLRGKTAIPGVNDGHFHPVGMGTGTPPLTLDVSKNAVSSISEIRDLVAAAVADKAPGEWVRGGGWDQGYLAENRFPTRQDLDDISPGNPVVLNDWSFHAVWVNGKAMELAGITRDTPSPDGGVIVKDGDGTPTGLFLESASGLVRSVVPPFTEKEMEAGLAMAVKIMQSEGVTSVTDGATDLAGVERYHRLQSDGRIRQRVVAMIGAGPKGDEDYAQALREAKNFDADEQWLSAHQVKLNADGVPTQSRTAWMYDEYVGGGFGSLVLPGDTDDEKQAELERRIMEAHIAGYQIGVHATGDRAIDATVTGFRKAIESDGNDSLRHYVIHGDLTPPATLKEMARLGIATSFNPSIKRSLSHQLTEVIGSERAYHQWPYRSALAAGVSVASSSDAPVVFPQFREGITAMLTRRSVVTGEVFGPDEVISFDEALHSYTLAGAYQDHAESWKGSIEQGKVGDIVILDADLRSIDAEAIVDVPVVMTIVGGEVVYDRSTTSLPEREAADQAKALAAAGAPQFAICCDRHGISAGRTHTHA